MLHPFGIQTIVITYPEYISNTWRAFYNSTIPELTKFKNPLGFDFMETVMSQADANQQFVMLGTGRGSDPTLTYDGCKDAKRLAAARSLSGKIIRELHAKYVKRHHCFSGWYITHECRDIQYASPYYDFVADLCHALTPGKPVMIAPDGSPVADAETIAASHVDIFAYQDAVGAGFVPAPMERYSFDPEQRLSRLDSIFSRYAT
ncbi:MAG: DUF4434 domain-containing protein [Fuerstiella sp.]|nr:DUF4434 domain-containing protein [Fuerstiella sp.]MCP4857151.1 DUF4434 domain-containing protein [Fuerstiella sp.]